MSNLPDYIQEMVKKTKSDIYVGFETARVVYRDITENELTDQQIKDSFKSEYIGMIGYLNRVPDMQKTDEQRAKIIAYQQVMNEMGIKR